MSLAYYNEHDPYAAHWLRNLVAAGRIAPGVVDERDIRDIRPEELIGFTQVHMFAGIGVWSHALRSAGWSDDREIWTGSCPCQPFSAAGRAGGFADERHLWPHWFWLVEQCRPPVVIGEQVASKDGLGWLDLVSADLEGAGYAFGATDLCAAGIGVEWQESQSGEWLRRAIYDCVDPVVRSMLCDFAEWAGEGNISEGGNHIRQRLYFVGLADTGIAASGRDAGTIHRTETPIDRQDRQVDGSDSNGHGASCDLERLADAASPRSLSGAQSGVYCGEESARSRDGQSERSGRVERLADTMPAGRPERGTGAGSGQTAGLRAAGGMGDTDSPRGAARLSEPSEREGRDAKIADDRSDRLFRSGQGYAAIGLVDGGWSDATDGRRYAKDWLFCRDDRWRAVEPRTFPLAHGVTARVGRLRAFGNALDAETSTRFCETLVGILDAADS